MEAPLPTAGEMAGALRAFKMHERQWRENHYVYPVVSRRSKGVSIGINLNPDKVCNFDCIYCSVDRTVPPTVRDVDLPRLKTELTQMLQWAKSGEIFAWDPFDKIPPALRRINDIAFSGDGEPTTFPAFLDTCRQVVEIKQNAGLTGVKIVVITNATMFHRPAVREALALLDKYEGEIWAKLDAGTQAYYQTVDRAALSLDKIVENIQWAASVRPIVIQSLFMKVHGNPPPQAESEAYAARLKSILAHGKIKLVQLYTVARRPTEEYATPLSELELQDIARIVTRAQPDLPVEIYP